METLLGGLVEVEGHEEDGREDAEDDIDDDDGMSTIITARTSELNARLQAPPQPQLLPSPAAPFSSSRNSPIAPGGGGAVAGDDRGLPSSEKAYKERRARQQAEAEAAAVAQRRQAAIAVRAIADRATRGPRR